MNRRMIQALLSASLVVSVTPFVLADSPAAPTPVSIELPQKDKPAAVLFVRLEQDQSRRAIDQLQNHVPAMADVQVVVVVSGPGAKDSPTTLANGWKVIQDAEYELAGKLSVHVWPTLVALDAKGAIVGHIGGVANTFVRDADAYLSHAAGKINAEELKARLASEQVVADSPKEKAARHLELARRMLDDGKLEAARAELKQAAILQPDDAAIKLLSASAALDAGSADEALATLDSITPGTAPKWQSDVIRLRTFVTLQRWDEAKSLLNDALKLNPDPAEAYYLAGVIYQHDQQFAEAADAFRKSCELSRKRKPGSAASAPDVK
jgi:tetratricopeptide (TPR) repeat protein